MILADGLAGTRSDLAVDGSRVVFPADQLDLDGDFYGVGGVVGVGDVVWASDDAPACAGARGGNVDGIHGDGGWAIDAAGVDVACAVAAVGVAVDASGSATGDGGAAIGGGAGVVGGTVGAGGADGTSAETACAGAAGGDGSTVIAFVSSATCTVGVGGSGGGDERDGDAEG